MSEHPRATPTLPDGRVPVEALRAAGHAVLGKVGVDECAARAVVDVLLEGDRRGVTSHGMSRLPSYVRRVEAGLLAPNARPEPVVDAGSMMLLDAGNGFGAVAGVEAARLAGERARRHGVAWLTVRNANHFGIAGYYPRLLALEGLAGVCFTNASPAVAAFGGKRAVLGTNPIAIAVPAEPEPVVLDIATTSVARGKIRRARAEGLPIAQGLALDRDGDPTTDPQAALEGTLASLGGHKGYGLAAMVELLTGVLGGGCFLTDVHQVTDLGAVAGVCFTLIGADIGRLTDRDAYLRRVGEFRRRIRASGDAGAAIYLPGEIDVEHARRADEEGIELPRDVVAAINAMLASG